jgi:hypothetical protein
LVWHLQLKTPRNYKEVMSFPDAKEWDEATIAELKQLKELKVFDITTLLRGRKALSTKWVYKKKLRLIGEVKKYKARCVVRGYLQKRGLDYNEL